ncbi:Uncharacterised protein [Pseudomonas aeruginosa]|nr:Uncharacterised protein [Pseudomonas aeruginosa]
MNSSLRVPDSSSAVRRFSRAVELVLEAQQQGQHDAAGGSQQALFGEGEAAEEEGHQQGDLGGHALVAATPDIAHVAGHGQRREGQQQGYPDCAAQFAREQGGEAAEQAGQAEGADSGDLPRIFVVALLPAALGADQKADGQGRAQAQQQIQGKRHARFHSPERGWRRACAHHSSRRPRGACAVVRRPP